MHRGTAFSILFCFCFLSLAGTLFAPPPKKVERKCSDGEDNDNDGATDCDDSDCASKDACTGGGDPPIAFPSTLDVQWSISGAGDLRNEISESPARHCFLESLTSGNYASYHCHHNVGPISPVFYMLEDQTVQQTARKGDATFCSAFVGELDFHTNASYQVSWDCRSIPCTVQITNWADGAEVQTKIQGADTVRLEAYFDADPIWPSAVSPDTIEITIKKDGTNKTAAKCVWSAEFGTPSDLANITFSQQDTSP